MDTVDRYRAAYERYSGEAIKVEARPGGRFVLHHRTGPQFVSEADIHGFTAYIEGKLRERGDPTPMPAQPPPQPPPLPPPPPPPKPLAPATKKPTIRTTREVITDMLGFIGPSSARALAGNMTVSQTTVLYHLHKLAEQGVVERRGEFRDSLWHLTNQA